MAVRLRLQRTGKPKRPYYRIVVVEQKSRRDGQSIEILGQYDPMAVGNKISVNMDRVNYWMSTGAKPSGTVAVLIKKKQMSDSSK